jgi:hypothetical protein
LAPAQSQLSPPCFLTCSTIRGAVLPWHYLLLLVVHIPLTDTWGTKVAGQQCRHNHNSPLYTTLLDPYRLLQRTHTQVYHSFPGTTVLYIVVSLAVVAAGADQWSAVV